MPAREMHLADTAWRLTDNMILAVVVLVFIYCVYVTAYYLKTREETVNGTMSPETAELAKESNHEYERALIFASIAGFFWIAMFLVVRLKVLQANASMPADISASPWFWANRRAVVALAATLFALLLAGKTRRDASR
jgi:hypothetical protein